MSLYLVRLGLALRDTDGWPMTWVVKMMISGYIQGDIERENEGDQQCTSVVQQTHTGDIHRIARPCSIASCRRASRRRLLPPARERWDA